MRLSSAADLPASCPEAAEVYGAPPVPLEVAKVGAELAGPLAGAAASAVEAAIGGGAELELAAGAAVVPG